MRATGSKGHNVKSITTNLVLMMGLGVYVLFAINFTKGHNYKPKYFP